MSDRSIGSSAYTSAAIRQAIQESPMVAIREVLTDRRILGACASCDHTYRERLYGPVGTVLHFVAQALQREDSFASTWQEMMTGVAVDFPEIDFARFDPSALTHARKRLPQVVMEKLAQQACEKARRMSKATWKRFHLVAIDCSTLSMPRNAELFAHFGKHKVRETTVRHPLATMGCLLDLDSAMVLDYRFGPFDPGERETTLPLLTHLRTGDLLIADRSFSGSPFLTRIYNTGADFLMRKNARLIVDRLPVVEQLGAHDFITDIPMDKEAHRADPDLPDSVRVRMFQATWTTPAKEEVTEWFVTSLTDAEQYPALTLALLYHDRWQIETSYHELKCALHTNILRSKTVDNIYKEMAAHVLAYQCIRQLIHQAANKRGKKPTEISFLNATRWIVHFSHRMSAAPTRMLPYFYQKLLDVIASTEVDVRPGRLEPRMLVRDRQHYPQMWRQTRAQWRQERLCRAE